MWSQQLIQWPNHSINVLLIQSLVIMLYWMTFANTSYTMNKIWKWRLWIHQVMVIQELYSQSLTLCYVWFHGIGRQLDCLLTSPTPCAVSVPIHSYVHRDDFSNTLWPEIIHTTTSQNHAVLEKDCTIKIFKHMAN